MVRSNTTSSVKLFRQPGTGKVEKTINHTHPGRVKWRASSWPAQFYQTDSKEMILPGEPVSVVGRQGITLLVEKQK